MKTIFLTVTVAAFTFAVAIAAASAFSNILIASIEDGEEEFLA
jgi:hypothetical protein